MVDNSIRKSFGRQVDQSPESKNSAFEKPDEELKEIRSKKRKRPIKREITAHSIAPTTETAQRQTFLSTLETKRGTIFSHGGDNLGEGNAQNGEGPSRPFEHRRANELSKEESKDLDTINRLNLLLLRYYTRYNSNLKPVLAYRQQFKDNPQQIDQETKQQALKNWKALSDLSNGNLRWDQMKDNSIWQKIIAYKQLTGTSITNEANTSTFEPREGLSPSEQVENLTDPQETRVKKRRRSTRKKISPNSLQKRKDRGLVWDDASQKLASMDQGIASPHQTLKETRQQDSKEKLTQEEIETLVTEVWRTPNFNAREFKPTSKEIQYLVKKLKETGLDTQQWEATKKFLNKEGFCKKDKQYDYFYARTLSKRSRQAIINAESAKKIKSIYGSTIHYKDKLAQEKGFENENDQNNARALKKGFRNRYDQKNACAKGKGFANEYDRENDRAQKAGFTNRYDRQNDYARKAGFANKYQRYSK